MASITTQTRTSGRTYYYARFRDDTGKRKRGFPTRNQAQAFIDALPDQRPRRRYDSPLDALVSRLVISDVGCWLWTGRVTDDGYGTISVAIDGLSRTEMTHRAAWRLLVGPIPPGHHLDHLCRVRCCCNPDHVEPVLPRINLMRAPGSVAAKNSAKTHCPAGHPYDDENTRWHSGYRYCRACDNSRNAR